MFIIDSTVAFSRTFPRAIRNTIECTLREHSIVMNRACGAFRSGSATAPFAHEVTGELSNKIKFILDRPLSQCYNASDEQRRS